MNDYEKKTADALVGKTIKKAKVTGDMVIIECEDGTLLDYSASDGGYSCWRITKNGEGVAK